MPSSGSWRVCGGLLALACEGVIGAEFDGYRKFPNDGGGSTSLGGEAGTAGTGAIGVGGAVGGVGGVGGAPTGGSGGASDASLDVLDAAQEAPNCLALTTPYPAGPYGADVDDVFPPLEWEGFVNESGVGLATDKPFVHYSMDLVRKSCKKYALLHNSEFT